VDLLPGLLDVVGHLLVGVRATVEVAEELGSVHLGTVEVVELEPELLREVANLVVTLVDELAAVLIDLIVEEEPATGPAASSDPVGSLVYLGEVARPLQPVRARETCEARTDDDDPPVRGCPSGGREASERGEAETCEPGAPQESRSSCRPLAVSLVGCDLRDRALHVLQERCASHRFPPCLSPLSAPR